MTQSKKKMLEIGFVLLALVAIPLTVFVAQKQQETRQRAAGEQVSMFFSQGDNCLSQVTNLTPIVGQQMILSLCLQTNSIPISAFDFKTDLGNTLNFVTDFTLTEGVDASKFNALFLNNLVQDNTGSYARFAKGSTADPVLEVNNQPLQLAKETFTVSSVGSGSISVRNDAQITSPTVPNAVLTVALPTLSYTIINGDPTTTIVPTPSPIPVCGSTCQTDNDCSQECPLCTDVNGIRQCQAVLTPTNSPTPSPTVILSPIPSPTGLSCSQVGGPCGTGLAGNPLGTCCSGLTCRTFPDGGTCEEPVSPTATPVVPTATSVPTPTVVLPTATLAPTVPGGTYLSLVVTFRGIGVPGGNCLSLSPDKCVDNVNPVNRTTRNVVLCLYAQRQSASADPLCLNGRKVEGTISFNGNTSNPEFVNPQFLLPSDLQIGSYDVLLTVDGYLRKRISGNQQITTTINNHLAGVRIIGMNPIDTSTSMNTLDLLDYNKFIDCYNHSLTCSSVDQRLTDFNDDGQVDNKDLQIFTASFTSREGD